ncbi:Thiol-disulfide isomerase or thioredoxin [Pedobacter caeni]|uniref:Thiol-disulfide isomerase or thioredoxin n=2 Tax=Pedobacter caeni TaxID=288992 RepID=A0A1M5PMP4_9SPHI|nr:Thiol-disulfide isomerase or thioredoxin [Pedobacter caeni]
MKRISLLCLLLTVILRVQGQRVEIKPERPNRGDEVTVTYHSGAADALISKEAPELNIVFTYSTFYELPPKLPMKKQGDNWVASFKLQRYATFASFYFQSGTQKDQPAADRHYTIAVYNGAQRVRDGYLHESYSLNAQMPKSRSLPGLQLDLLQKELTLYPENYEARVRVQSTKMILAKTPEEKLKYRNEARRIIAAKFEEAPTIMANLNKVTMGYLIIGEKSRLDSLRRVVLERYPKSDVARDYMTTLFAKEKDVTKKIAELEKVLKENDQEGEEGSTGIHSILFDHYLSTGQAKKAVYHAGKTMKEISPQTPLRLKEIAAKLTAGKLAPDTAIAYAERSLRMVDQWPVGVIRFFPEYGHIPSFVADSTRLKAVVEARSTLLSIIALNKLYLGDRIAALDYISQSAEKGTNRESLINIATVYEQTGDPRKAFDALWKILLDTPEDTTVTHLAKLNFLKFNPSEAEFKAKVKELEGKKIARLTNALKKQKMNAPGPELTAITDLRGNVQTKEMRKGKVVVLDFWATWCVPCMQEMPYLQKVYHKYKNNPDVMFMVVNTGAKNTIKDAIDWGKKNPQYDFPLYFNSDPDIGEKVGFTLIPTIAVIDQQGALQFRTIGFEGAELEHKLAVQIDILLEEVRK